MTSLTWVAQRILEDRSLQRVHLQNEASVSVGTVVMRDSETRLHSARSDSANIFAIAASRTVKSAQTV